MTSLSQRIGAFAIIFSVGGIGMAVAADDQMTGPAGDRMLGPASDGMTGPASDGMTGPASDGMTAPASDGMAGPADDRMTDQAISGDQLPGNQGIHLGTPWVTGGVGKSEREAMLQAYSDYNLKLEFAVADGSYLADVAVTITSDDGAPVLSVISTGPWLMTKLPAGDYAVAVSGFEETFVENVTVPASGMETVVFSNWTKAGVAEVTPGPAY